MPGRVGKLHDLVFHRRTVARAPTGDGAAVQRGLLDMGLDDLLNRLSRPGNPARHLPRQLDALVEGEAIAVVLPVLPLDLAPFDGPSVNAWRSPRLEA